MVFNMSSPWPPPHKQFSRDQLIHVHKQSSQRHNPQNHQQMEPNEGLIAVHVGAGQHSESLKKKYQKLCRLACEAGCQVLRAGKTPMDAVVASTMVLEDSPLTNAGFGSNLTLDGQVECDASVMDGSRLLFGSVGAVSGVKNPVLLAQRLCEHQTVRISHGRVPPSVLVGPGAHAWATEMGVETIPGEDLVSSKAKKIYHHYKRKLDDPGGDVKVSRPRLDTVGAVCVDRLGNVASACSSGGIILKCPGRVGQAGVWGCGVWAKAGIVSVGASTSGCGEHLIKTTLARTIAEAVGKKFEGDGGDCVRMLHEAVDREFIGSEFLQGVEQKMGGGIVVRYDGEEGLGDLFWTHSTNSMILGYMNSKEGGAVGLASMLETEEVGRKAVVQGVPFKF
ncbi:threonine aspartase 1 [Diachasma alloeum]|uniref:threonine aspartase 1 n=1 Tax=Diachasma alloeum TaxID=454923 RepID=UPI0007383492|nr:threonine aspartase 1 [Diachasma alloeum]